MRILHTADWHLGKIVNEFSMLDLQREYLEKLIKELEELEVDVLIMAGDLYDRAIPPKEAISLANEIFTKITQELEIAVFVIAGNHDSNERLEYGSALLSASQLYIEGTSKKEIRKVEIDQIHFYLIPYDDHRKIRQIYEEKEIKTPEDALKRQLESIEEDWDPDAINILLYHGFIANMTADVDLEESDSERPLSIGTVDFVPYELVKDFDYVALGHLHKAQKVGNERIRYSGSPLKYSKSEAKHQKENILIDITKESFEISPLKIRPSKDIRLIRGKFSEIIQKQSEDYIFFELEDKNYIVDAMNKLRRKYPYTMGLEYINQKEKEKFELKHTKEKIKKTSLKELFSDFYEQNIELPLNEKQEEVVIHALETVNEKEN
ncbi:MAG: exonuclease SbcCD subunit D [Atopostipes suicloacalis]|nr:exonuclease SbcCD subunit D [Atopostipes suicloacalis]